MKTIRWVIVAVILALLALAAANASTFAAPTRLSLLVTEFEAPLGLLMLGVTAVITGLFFIYAASLRTSTLLESRRLTRELEEQRVLADQAESSRFTELRSVLEQGVKGLEEKIQSSGTAALERADALEQGLRSGLEESTNTLAAHIGQVDDKLERSLERTDS